MGRMQGNENKKNMDGTKAGVAGRWATMFLFFWSFFVIQYRLEDNKYTCDE